MIVSVIIPVYNSATTIAAAIKSAVEQSLRDIEIIIYDDASTDNSLELALKAAAVDPRIHVMRAVKNGGKSRGMNAAIEIARGRWIAILDADDTYEPDRLRTLVNLGERTCADLVADNQNHIDGAKGSLFLTAFQPADAVSFLNEDDFIVSSSSSSGSFDYGLLKPVIRRKFIKLKDLKYNSEARFSEDFYYMIEFFVKGGKAVICHRPLYNWTLPFSPSARTWSMTGAGAWRYDYANAIATNNFYLSKYRAEVRTKWVSFLQRRGRSYARMQHYIHAQRLFEQERQRIAGAIYILRHPDTWALLIKRISGRTYRKFKRVKWFFTNKEQF